MPTIRVEPDDKLANAQIGAGCETMDSASRTPDRHLAGMEG